MHKVKKPFGGKYGRRNLHNNYQPCARYLEGDKIPTKIGSGRVEIEIGMAYPDFPTNRDRVGMAYPDFPTNRDRVEITVLEFPGQNRGKSRFSPSFPVLFRSKTPGKVGKNREKSRKVG